MRLTISGPIGSGKSTVGRIISQRLGIDFFSGGYFFRKQAEELGMTVEEFNIYAEMHEEVDRKLDSMIEDFLRTHDNVLVESRLSGWICHRSGIEAFKIFLSASLDVRFGRIARREGNDAGLRGKIIERENSEMKRYKLYYGIDYSDTSIYDLVINSDNMGADEVAEVIYDSVRAKYL